MKTIGERIKELRESKDLTSKDICSVLDFNPSTYSKLENDKKSIDVDELRKLTQFYAVSADHILGIEEPTKDIVLYMQRDKNMDSDDISEIQMVISLMDEALTLRDMKMRI